ncbi:MAG: histidinol dehydrogenase [Anaerolineales bacterium]
MLKILDVQTASQTILKRTPPDEMSVPEALLDGIQSVFGERIPPAEAVRRILKDVRNNGDAALRQWAERLDGSAPADFRVQPDELSAALASIPNEQQEALKVMADRIEAFHRRQPLTSWITNDLGGTLGQWIKAIRRVGLYVPGGTAPLPSSVLMTAIPARVAGVSQTLIMAPPQKDNGKIAPIILAAAAVAGVSEVYTLGGAQAIAAMAYGTESIPAVDKLFGPGNLFVTLAKQQVFGVVGIDGLAGPTETMIIADGNARPSWVAADLLAQAEHDLLASAILLTPSRDLAEQVQVEVARQIEERSRAEIIATSLQNRGGAVITHDLWEAAELANRYAPEHLCLAVKDPWSLAERINAAGGVFMGEHSFEVLGDYVAGPSHVMPTGGSARYASPLNVWDFVHIVSLVALDQETARRISQPAAVIALAENLDAHANAAGFRLKEQA